MLLQTAARYYISTRAEMAELVDALDSKSSEA